MAYQKEEEKKKETNTFAIILTFIVVIFILIVLVPLTIPKKQANLDKSSCLTDSDCVCGGIDKLTNSCFIGNKAYYDLYVDKGLYCPDFCEGVGNNLKTRCANKVCAQVAGIEKQCDFDVDCIKIGLGDKCSNGICSYRTRPTGSGTECAQDSDCVAKNLGNRCSRGVCTGLKPECTTNQDCINQGLGTTCSMGRCSITNMSGQCFSDIDCPQPDVACICTSTVQDCPKAKCYSNRCTTVNGCPAGAECSKSSDCTSSSCCTVPSCVPVDEGPNCTNVTCPCDITDPTCAPAQQAGCACLKNKCIMVQYGTA